MIKTENFDGRRVKSYSDEGKKIIQITLDNKYTGREYNVAVDYLPLRYKYRERTENDPRDARDLLESTLELQPNLEISD